MYRIGKIYYKRNESNSWPVETVDIMALHYTLTHISYERNKPIIMGKAKSDSWHRLHQVHERNSLLQYSYWVKWGRKNVCIHSSVKQLIFLCPLVLLSLHIFKSARLPLPQWPKSNKAKKKYRNIAIETWFGQTVIKHDKKNEYEWMKK